MMEKPSSRFPRRLFASTMVIVVLYACIVGWFLLSEESYVYFPRKGLRDADTFNVGIETVTLQSHDGTRLVCWITPAAESSGVWLLYFQGNGGNISSRGNVEQYKIFREMGIHTFALGYRGYGLSEGSPAEKGLYLDARAAFDYLVKVRRVPPRSIILFGFSLGSAVAVELATHVEARAVILEGAFASAVRVGQDVYPFLPVSFMMRNRFDSMSRIRAVHEPILFLHAVQDEIVPIEHARELFAVANEPKMFVETAGGHNTAHSADSALFYGSIASFLQRLK